MMMGDEDMLVEIVVVSIAMMKQRNPPPRSGQIEGSI
jgi:hypothetical protein